MKKENKKFKKISKTLLLSALTLCSSGLLMGCNNNTENENTSGNVWYVQNFSPTDSTKGSTGDMYLNSSTYDLYRKADYGWVFVGNIKGSDGANGLKGDRGWKGENGDEVQLRVFGDYIQWKYENSASWTDLIALSSLIGPQGTAGENAREVEFQTTQTHIQWRYIAKENENQSNFQWENLVDLTAISGTIGKDGKSAYEIAKENGFEGNEVEWLNSLKGEGATWHVENFAPTSEYPANEDDLFLNIATCDMFKLNSSGWTLIGNIKGTSPTIEINSAGYWVINGIPTEVLADQSKAETTAELLAYNYLELSEFEGKRITILGDSVSVGVGSSDIPNKSYAALLGSILNAEIDNLGINGTTFCEGLIDKDNVSANSRYSDVKNYTKETDYFIVELGINDWARSDYSNLLLGTLGTNNINTFYGAVNYYAKTLKQKYQDTNTKVIFLTPTISRTYIGTYDPNAKNSLGYSLRDICNAIIETANLYDIQVLDLNKVSGIYYNSSSDYNADQYLADGLHPNDAGHALIANKIIEFLQNNFEYVPASSAKTVILNFYPGSDTTLRTNRSKVVNGGKFKLPELVKQRTGYTFKYWKDGSNNIYYPGDVITVNSNVTLTAEYAKSLTVSVTNIVGSEKTTASYDLAYSTDIDASTNKLISEPISSIELTSASYGLVPTIYSDEGLTTKLDTSTTFLEDDTPTIYVNWETDANWFTVENGAITGRTESFPVSYSSSTEIKKLIFPKTDTEGNAITTINVGSGLTFFLNQYDHVANGNTIGSDVFKNTTEFYIPEGYTSITGTYFFTVRGTNSTKHYCNTKIYIPSTLTNMPNSSFANIQNAKFYIHENNTAYSSKDNMWLNKAENKLIRYTDVYVNDVVATSYVIPNTITTIDTYALYGNVNLTEITLSENLTTTLGQNHLHGMKNLTKIIITKNMSDDGSTGTALLQSQTNSQGNEVGTFAQLSSFVTNGSIYVIDENDKTFLTSKLSTYTDLLSRIYVISAEE